MQEVWAGLRICISNKFLSCSYCCRPGGQARQPPLQPGRFLSSGKGLWACHHCCFQNHSGAALPHRPGGGVGSEEAGAPRPGRGQDQCPADSGLRCLSAGVGEQVQLLCCPAPGRGAGVMSWTHLSPGFLSPPAVDRIQRKFPEYQ